MELSDEVVSGVGMEWSSSEVCGAIWAARGAEELDLPFLPEFDHPDKTIRDLAGIEAWRRDVALTLEVVVDQRRDAVAAAAAAGHSRRSLGRLLDLSYARVQQLIAKADALEGY